MKDEGTRMKTGNPKPEGGVFNWIRKAVSGAMASIEMRWHVATANLWRDQYNPLRSLTMQRAVTLLEEGERGAYADLQWTYRYIEMQDAVLGALIAARSSALEEMDWDIRVSDAAKSASEKALAEAQAAVLKDVYDGIQNFQDAIEFLALASFRGFAHLEIVRNADGDIVELAKVPQWHWVRAGLAGTWQYNKDSKIGMNRGEDVPLDRFIIREVDRPINRVALVCFLRKSMSQKDWDAFVETFGVPAIFVIMPPELGEPQREEFQDIAEQVIGNARGVLPGNSKLETVDQGGRGANPFRDHIKYQDEQMVLRGTGGKLTMLTESGSGTLAGTAHTDAFERLAAAEAKKISEIFQKSIDAVVLAEKFPGKPVFASFQIAENEETDTSAIVKDVADLSGAGYKVRSEWIEEKTGYAIESMKDEALKDEGGKPEPDGSRSESSSSRLEPELKEKILNREFKDEPNLLAAAAGLLEVARKADHKGLAEGLRGVLVLEDDALADGLQAWFDGLPDEVGNSPEMEAAWEKVLVAALGEGMVEGSMKDEDLKDEGVMNNSNNCGNGKNGFQPGNHCAGKKGERREGKTKDEGDHFGPRYRDGMSEDEAEARLQELVPWLLKHKTGTNAAAWRKGLGRIDLPWGTAGAKADDFKGGHGLLHILSKHGEADVLKLPKVLARGEILISHKDRNKREIKSGEYTAVVVKDQESSSWLLTGFTKNEN